MEKRIVICIGTDESKHVRARLSLLLMEGEDVGFRHYHSISIEPGADLVEVRAANEAHIAKPGGGVPMAPWPAIPDEEWEKVEKCCTVIHTPEILFAATTEVEAQLADIRQKRAALEKETKRAETEAQALAAQKAENTRIKEELQREAELLR